MSRSGEPTRKFIFCDWRHVQCGNLRWHTPGGQVYGVTNPPEPQQEMHAAVVGVPYGIRLAAQPARKTDPVADWRGRGRIIHDGGVYRSWYLEVNGSAKLGSGSVAEVANPPCVAICHVQSEDGFAWSEPDR